MSKKFRKGDNVLVIAGNDRGKTGQILARSGDRVLIQGVNVRKKHLRPTQKTQQQAGGGRIVEMEMPIHISNVALCTKAGEKIRVRVKESKEGSRELVFQTSGQETVYRPIKKPA